MKKRGAMPHIKGKVIKGKVIPGTDVAHFVGLSLKVGQRGTDYRGVSMREISNGSPGLDSHCGGRRLQQRPHLLPPGV